MRCGLRTGSGPCDRHAVGLLRVRIWPGEHVVRDETRESPALLAVCDRHLAAAGVPAEAVFDDDQPQPNYPRSHQPDVTLTKESI